MMEETQLGRVSSVFVDEELNKVFVSVVTAPGVESREIPFLTSKPSFWLVPEEGDIVEVAVVGKERVARFPHNVAGPPLPEGLDQGDVCLKLDEGTEILFQRRGDGEDAVYDVTVRASGNVTVRSGEELRLLDEQGYGIVGHGEGQFIWHHEHIELDPEDKFVEETDEESE